LSVYGVYINAHVVQDRHVTDAVSAVNFDYRALDTLGEEFILFASVLGAVVLLREAEEKRERVPDHREGRQVPLPSEAVLGWSLATMGFTVLFGIYIVLHGQSTPGGGFQGGAILATAPILFYLAKNLDSFQKIAPYGFAETGEAIGAMGFVLLGLWSLIAGGKFLQNVMWLGQPSTVVSGGTITWISIVTGLEVSGGLLLLMVAFLQFAFSMRKGAKEQE
jgi:multicomponent Na+:H+ antiporter subunit B